MFTSQNKLLFRLQAAINDNKKLTFLFGSAITAPGSSPAELGVPTPYEMVQLLKSNFTNPEEKSLLEKELAEAAESTNYQKAMTFLWECRGQGALNQLVRQAVLKARHAPTQNGVSDADLEHDLAAWHLRPAVEAFAKLVKAHPNVFKGPHLTSNFDPLLEIAIRKTQGYANSIVLPDDGKLNIVFSQHNTVDILHFHGFWRGNDTLHTPSQLTKERPLLRNGLRQLLTNTTLVVMGYGGWDDIFTRTLIDVVSENNNEIDVIWCFYSEDQDKLKLQHGKLLEALSPLIARRIMFYCGVDCHKALPALAGYLPLSPHIEINVPKSIIAADETAAPCDTPPLTTAWVGRIEDIISLSNNDLKVAFITGIGGQGKSSLAAKYLSIQKEKPELTYWDWRDCREESNTLHTQLVRIIERLSNSRIQSSELLEQSTDAIIKLFFAILEHRKALFIFDNIDQYIDISKSSAVEPMNTFVTTALKSHHRSRFVFTCRPSVTYFDQGFHEIRLAGLNSQEVRSLFEAKKVPEAILSNPELIEKITTLTKGHPLWLNLLATQISSKPDSTETLLSKLREGSEEGVMKSGLVHQIWSQLNDREKTVLRYLAETVRPQTEEDLADLVKDDLNANRFDKAIKSLKRQDLVVLKRAINHSETIELHPLIRDFVKQNFSLRERTKYIRGIIFFYDKFIGKFRTLIGTEPDSNILANWTSKAELATNSGDFQSALDALYEACHPLIRIGEVEEFARLASNLVNAIGWEQETVNKLGGYDFIVKELIDCLSHLGRFPEAEVFISKYSSTVTGKTARFVCLCEAASQFYWIQGIFKKAIEWAKEGVDVKKGSNLDTKHDCEANLALALRDDGQVDLALPLLLKNEKIESLLNNIKSPSERPGSYYGNIGRCLMFKGDTNAEIFLKLSARKLETGKDANTKSNQGYAAFWLGQINQKLGNIDIACVCYERACYKWRALHRPRYSDAFIALGALNKDANQSIECGEEKAEVNRRYLAYINN